MKDRKIRGIRNTVSCLALSLLLSGCGMFGSEAEVKVDFGQFGNTGGSLADGETGETPGAETTGPKEEKPDGEAEESGPRDGTAEDTRQAEENENSVPESTQPERDGDFEKRMEEFHKSEFAAELTSYLESVNRGDEAFSEPIFDSQNKVYSKEELEGLSDVMCKIFRNEIYARHGMIFGDEDLNQLYGAFDWYEGTISLRDFEAQAELPFNATENKNISNVVAVEKARKEKNGAAQ